MEPKTQRIGPLIKPGHFVFVALIGALIAWHYIGTNGNTANANDGAIISSSNTGAPDIGPGQTADSPITTNPNIVIAKTDQATALKFKDRYALESYLFNKPDLTTAKSDNPGVNAPIPLSALPETMAIAILHSGAGMTYVTEVNQPTGQKGLSFWTTRVAANASINDVYVNGKKTGHIDFGSNANTGSPTNGTPSS